MVNKPNYLNELASDMSLDIPAGQVGVVIHDAFEALRIGLDLDNKIMADHRQAITSLMVLSQYIGVLVFDDEDLLPDVIRTLENYTAAQNGVH